MCDLNVYQINCVCWQVFKQAYIPRTLDEVIHFEQDIHKAQAGDTAHVSKPTLFWLIYKSTITDYFFADIYKVNIMQSSIKTHLYTIVMFWQY